MKLIKILFIIFFITFSNIAYAQELFNDEGVIVEFEQFPADITLDGKVYSGILISETDKRSWIQTDIDNKYYLKQIDILERHQKETNESYNKMLESHTKAIDTISDLSKKSWFDVNGVWVTMALGFVIGAVATGVIVSL